jgi:hypothetical protein
MYTEAQLNGMTKAQIIDATLKLTSRVESLSSGPVTADTIKAAYLSLKKEGADIAERRQNSQQAHKEALAEIEANKLKAIAEMELKYNSADGQDAKELDKLYADLEARSMKAIKDLTFGLEKAENDAAVELSKLAEKTEKAQAKYDELVKDLTAKEKSLMDAYIADTDAKTVAHRRKMEQLQYDNAIALRDGNIEFMEKLASSLGMEVIDSEELEGLKEFKKTDSDAINEIVKVEVAEASQKIYAAEGAKASALKYASETKIALLENDKKHLEAAVSSQANRIVELEARLKEVPNQIAAAVQAAQSSVTVNQDAVKK